MGFLDNLCDAILGENQSDNGSSYATKVRVSWSGYYRSIDGRAYHTYVEKVIPIDLYKRSVNDIQIAATIIGRAIDDCVQLEDYPRLTVEEYI